MLALTGSPAQAGLVAALRTLPFVILCLPVGALVDRWNRKRVMMICDSGAALAVATIPVAMALHRLTLTQLYVIAVVEGTFFVFFNLANTASLPRIVRKEQLPEAVSRNYTAFSVAFLLGPLVGGALYGVHRALPFIVDAISFGVSVISLSFMRATFQGERSNERRSLRAEIGEGLRWLWRRPTIRLLGFFITIQVALVNGMPLIVIVLAQHRHATPAAVGIILAVGGVGGALGSVIAPLVQRRLGFARSFLSAYWLFTLAWPLLALVPGLVGLALASALVLVLWFSFDMLQFSYRLAQIPDALQGRVNSVFRLGAFAGQTVGLALDGALAQAIGPTATVFVLGAGLLVLAIIITVSPEIRTLPGEPVIV